MPDFEKMYYLLFNAVTDALKELENDRISDAMIRLASAQCRCEDLYLDAKRS